MATTQNEELAQVFYGWWRIYQQKSLKSSVKLPAMRQQLKQIFIFPIITLWKLKVAIATKVHMQQQ